MLCSNCKKELLEAAVFCIYCGIPAAPLERKPLKPGKRFGITSLVLGAAGWLGSLVFFIYVLLDESGLLAEPAAESFWLFVSLFIFCLPYVSSFCAIAGIVYGILGHNTEGQRYAHAGLMLAILYILLVLLLLLPFIVCLLLIPPFIAYLIVVLNRYD